MKVNDNLKYVSRPHGGDRYKTVCQNRKSDKILKLPFKHSVSFKDRHFAICCIWVCLCLSRSTLGWDNVHSVALCCTLSAYDLILAGRPGVATMPRCLRYLKTIIIIIIMKSDMEPNVS